jgi:radical SAM-linked protein
LRAYPVTDLADDIHAADGQASGEETRQRLRLLYTKGEAVKFIAHQDEFRLWERALRRAGLPLLYKQGFNPQPHIQFAAPLGVGFTGAAELIDIILSPPVDTAQAAAAIRAKLPPGVTLLDLSEIPLKLPALQSLLIGADYTIVLYAEPGELESSALDARLADLLTRREILRRRQRKGEYYHYNLRPLILELTYRGYDPVSEEHRIFLRVQQRPGATGRPDEVVDALELDTFARTLRRDRLYFADNPHDAALFARYPVVTQADIARPTPTVDHTGDPARACAPRRTPAGRSINERAGDEFV